MKGLMETKMQYRLRRPFGTRKQVFTIVRTTMNALCFLGILTVSYISTVHQLKILTQIFQNPQNSGIVFLKIFVKS